MVSHTPNVDIETTTSRDGLLSSAKSMLGGESLLANEFTPAIAESLTGTGDEGGDAPDMDDFI
jgi:uncharacterized protein (AIM24 family)